MSSELRDLGSKLTSADWRIEAFLKKNFDNSVSLYFILLTSNLKICLVQKMQ